MRLNEGMWKVEVRRDFRGVIVLSGIVSFYLFADYLACFEQVC